MLDDDYIVAKVKHDVLPGIVPPVDETIHAITKNHTGWSNLYRGPKGIVIILFKLIMKFILHNLINIGLTNRACFQI